MNSVALIARLVLALVFATAGLAKLNDLQASRDTVEAFGFPRSLARPFGTLLPVAELAVAVALLPSASARWASVAGLALLIAFNAGVAYALSQGRTPDCNCFGQVSSEQIGPRTLARNAVIALVAVLAIWKAPGSSLTGWTHDASAANLTAALLAVTAALLAVGLLHFRARARALPAAAGAPQPQAAGLPIGSPAPDFELSNLDGETVSRDDLLAAGRPLVMIFASPTCGPCQALMPELGRWHAALNESITFAVIESGASGPGGLRETLRSAGDVTVLIEEGRDTAEMFGANATPTALAINPSGMIASQPMPGQTNIEGLVRTILNAAQQEPNRPAAAAAPQR